MYKYILFDLDGTLTDPGEGITNSVAYALEKFNIINTDRTELYPFIGPPLLDSFMNFYGFSREDGLKAVEYYRENFRSKGILENRLYPGIPEILQTLKSQGRRVILATSKPEEFAKRILDYFDLTQYFDFIAGATMDGSRGKKADVIAYALKENGVKDPVEAIMVGDREFDVQGAGENGLEAIGVSFGYGSREELTSAGAKYIADTPFDIVQILMDK